MEIIDITKSQEEYLKTVYILESINGEVHVTDIAKRLEISKPSVTRTIKKLSKLKLLNYEAYKSITLTENGKNIAKEIIKKQDTIKNFLYEILDVDEDLAQREASNMRHFLSPKTIKKIEEHVDKLLNLGGSKCKCSENSDECKKCIKYQIRKKIQSGRNLC